MKLKENLSTNKVFFWVEKLSGFVIESVEGLLLRIYRIVLILRWLDMGDREFWSLYRIINKNIPISSRSYKWLLRFMRRIKLVEEYRVEYIKKVTFLRITKEGKRVFEESRGFLKKNIKKL